MARKATHNGECQWCASRQKLPSGVLAKHGYTVRHGWFSGICAGTGYEPYELSCGLIERSIVWAQEQRVRIVEAIAQVKAVDPTKTNKAWRHIYHRELSTRTRGSVYLWEHGTYEAVDDSPYQHVFKVDDSERKERTDFGQLVDKVRDGNKGYVKHLERQVVEIDEYIAAQKRRVDAWVLKELQPV